MKEGSENEDSEFYILNLFICLKYFKLFSLPEILDTG